jgi:Spx/MgsR family transcriptional regulator
MLTLYGIKNCDTVKKARTWLAAQNRPYRFHDFRADGMDLALLEKFAAAIGWEALLNRRGTTWRRLREDQREGVDRDKALALMLEYPTLIKRPVLDTGTTILAGFSPEDYANAL